MMMGLSGSELLLIVVVAVVVIGPKELPSAMLMAGKYIGKMRRMAGKFQAGVENAIREAEIDDLEVGWAAKREAILAQYAAQENGDVRLEQGESAVSTKIDASPAETVAPPLD